MAGRVSSHLRSNVIGYLALFLALGGVSYAAVDLSRNSVGKAEIAKDAVGGSEIVDNAVGFTNTTVRSNSRTFAVACDPSGFDTQVCFAEGGSVKATCGAGERATGGGYLEPTGIAGDVVEDRPDPVTGTPDGWVVDLAASGGNETPSEETPTAGATVYAVCAA